MSKRRKGGLTNESIGICVCLGLIFLGTCIFLLSLIDGDDFPNETTDYILPVHSTNEGSTVTTVAPEVTETAEITAEVVTEVTIAETTVPQVTVLSTEKAQENISAITTTVATTKAQTTAAQIPKPKEPVIIPDFTVPEKTFTLPSPISVPEDQVTVVNVKDFGAKGDGVSNDRYYIYKAFEYAIAHLPATVYFPEGEYAFLNGGLTIKLPLGSGNLTVKGDGAEKSIIKYPDDWTTKGSWVALRIQPESTPKNTSEYLHDITITDFGVYDTDPVKHAWTVEKNGAKEETHGFDIQYTVRACIKNCMVDSVGDEAIDMVYCIDSLIIDNTVKNSPGAGSAGGAISVGDGCDNVYVIGNTVDGTIASEDKVNFGIAIEAITEPVKNITVASNDVKNIAGNGINIAAPQGSIDNVLVYDNTISYCTRGVHFSGKGEKNNILISGISISNVQTGFYLDGQNTGNTVIEYFSAEKLYNRFIHIVSPSTEGTVLRNGVARKMKMTAAYNAGNNTLFENVYFDEIGLAGNVTTPAISQYAKGGSLDLSQVYLLNCKTKKAINGARTMTDVFVD